MKTKIYLLFFVSYIKIFPFIIFNCVKSWGSGGREWGRASPLSLIDHFTSHVRPGIAVIAFRAC